MNTKTEPARVAAAISAALIAIWNVIVIAAQIDPEVAGAVNLAIGAVIAAVLSIWVRGRVTPTDTS